jgi:hypothetical protein
MRTILKWKAFAGTELYTNGEILDSLKQSLVEQLEMLLRLRIIELRQTKRIAITTHFGGL